MVMKNEFHIAFYAVALTLCATIFFFTMLQKRYDRPQNKLFIAMIIIVACNSISGLTCAIVEPFKWDGTMYIVLLVFQFLYFFIHPALAAVFYFYSATVTGSVYSFKREKFFLFSLPIIITELVVLVNPLMGWVYYYDAQRVFNRNSAELLLYFTAALYFVLTMYQLMHSWRELTSSRRNAILYFMVLTIVGIALQAINIHIKTELFAEAFAMLGIMLAVETEDDRLDSDSGFYNRKALKMDMDDYFATGQKFFIICIKIENSEIIRRVTGSSNTDILSGILADYLRSQVKRYYIYCPNPEAFIITYMHSDRMGAAALAERISKRFESYWNYGEIELHLNAVVMYVEAPTEIKSTEDVFYMADQPVPEYLGANPLMGEDLNYLTRRMDIENAIHRTLSKRGFKVYYQPTFCLDGSLHGAEALVRLKDPEMGFVSPEDFIPIAEQMGVIDDIDDFVLHEVCSFLHSGVPERFGLNSINVNLSVIQCMKPGFVGHINEIVESHGIDKDQINFEITESVAANDYSILSNVVSELKGSGFMFSMDDFGTGYSNMSSMFSLDFDIVKIDKSILWGAFESEHGRIILENSVAMIRRMGQQILVEGVETAEQLDLLQKLRVDYLQGYYFSKPLPQDDFVAFISDKTEAAKA